MERIHKLPFILGSLAALIAGIVCNALHMGTSAIYIRMAVMMVAFFILGLYIKNNIISIKKEVKEKLIEDAIKGLEEFRMQKDEEKAQSANMNKNMQSNLGQNPLNGENKSLFEIAMDKDDDFKPLNVSKAIKTKLSD